MMRGAGSCPELLPALYVWLPRSKVMSAVIAAKIKSESEFLEETLPKAGKADPSRAIEGAVSWTRAGLRWEMHPPRPNSW